MPPNTSDGPLNTLEQIRDLLAQVLGQREQQESDRANGETESQPRQKREPTEAEKLNEQKDRAKGVFDAGVGVLGSIGGAPGQIAAALRQADMVAKSILEFGQSLGNWWSPEKKKKESSSPESSTVPTTPQPMKPAPVPAAPEPEKKSGGDTQPIQPAPTLTPPPAVASPVPAAPTLATPTVPTPQPQQVVPPTVLEVPTIPAPQPEPRREVPTFTPPNVPVLPTKLDLAPETPVPLPGLATDVDTRIPRAEREIQAPIGQTAPVLIPGAPGGESGAAPSNDSARLAAALEKLVVFLDKADKKDGDTAGKEGDETEQGENFQPRSMWRNDQTGSTPSDTPRLLEPPLPPTEGRQPKKDDLEAGEGPIGGFLRGIGLGI